MKIERPDYGGYYDDYDLETPSAGMLCFDRPSSAAMAPAAVPAAAPAPSMPALSALSPADLEPDRDSANSMAWVQTTTDNSSCGSEHVLSPSPDLPDRDHAESQPGAAACAWWAGGVDDWGCAVDDGFVVDVDGTALFGPPSPGLFARVDAAAFADVFASYMH